MIGEREQVKSKASAGVSLTPVLRASTPTIEVGTELSAPMLAPRVGHRFQEMAVVPDTAPTTGVLPEEKVDAPREGGNGKAKQAAPTKGKPDSTTTQPAPTAPKQKVQEIEFDVTLGVLTFTLQDGTTIQTKPTFNGEPDYGDYIIPVEDGVIPDSAIVPCKRTQDGQALKWTYPEGTTLEGVPTIKLHVVGIDQPMPIVPLPVKSDDKKGGKGKADQGTAEKGREAKGKGEGDLGGEGKKDGASSTVTGTAPRGKPTTEPSSAPTTQPSTAPTTEPTTAPTSQPTATPSASDAKAYEEFLKSLSPELQEFLTAPGGEIPTDLAKFKEVVQELQTLSPQELDLLEKATNARTNDLDLFLTTVKWFKSLSPEEKKFVAMTQDEKLVAAKKQAIEASGAALQEAIAHPFSTAYQMTIGQLGFGGESFKKAGEDFEKAKHSSGEGRRGFLMGGLSKSLMGVSQATLTLGLIVGGAALLFAGPAVLLGSLAVAGILGTAALFAQIDAGMSHLDAAAEAKTLAEFKEHSKAASEEFASLTLVPLGMLLLAALLKGLKFGLGKALSKQAVADAKALDAAVEASEQVQNAIDAIDAELVNEKKLKPPVEDLPGVRPDINAIFKKQEQATPTERAAVKEYAEEYFNLPPEQRPNIAPEVMTKLWIFTGEPPAALSKFASKVDVSQAVEKALTESSIQEKKPFEAAQEVGENKTIRGSDIIQALEADPGNKANRRVLDVIREIFSTQESPRAYGRTMGEIWERAKIIQETQQARIEATGRSPFTLAMIDMLAERGVKIEIVTGEMSGAEFKERILEPGAAFVDMYFEGKRHKISPHLLEYLVLDDMLQTLEPPTTMKEFLSDLAKVTGSEGLDGEIWDLVLDSVMDSMHGPEYLMGVLRSVIPELE